MAYLRYIKMLAVISPIVLAGCVSTGGENAYSDPELGFATVSAKTADAVGKQTVWVQNQTQAAALSQQVHGLVHKKSISADTAVQVALLNNKGLQAAYADIGMSAAEVWQQSLPENPKVSIGILGIGAPEFGILRAIEGMIATNILSAATRKGRVDLADTRFRQSQLVAANETLRVAADARRAWINAVGAFETIYYLNQGAQAADAAAELGKKLGETGALNKAGQAREQVFYSELVGQRAEAKLAAQLAKEDLTRIMGLWGTEVDYFVPDRLPALPKGLKKPSSIEKEALQNRIDLQVAKLELEAVAKSYGLTKATRYVTDLGLLSATEIERTIDEDGNRGEEVSQNLELDFVIPIFDSGEARMRKAELAYLKAANLLAEKAVNIRSEARSGYTSYRATYDIARHYKNSVLPLRVTIEEEALLSNNGMISNTFELLADTRAKISALLQSVNGKKAFWLADANLSAVIYGGGADAGGGGGSVALADNGASPH